MKAGVVELEIERIVAGGAGLARTDAGVVLVRGGLPGEVVTARPRESGGGVRRAHVIDILRPHPARLADELPPGADLPLAYEAQLPIKHGLVVEALQRIAKLDAPVEPVRPSPKPLGYRTVAQYAVVDGSGLGARAIDSDRIVPLQSDPLLAEPLARAFAVCADRTLHGIEEIVLRGSLREDRCLVGLVGDAKAPLGRIARGLGDAGIAGVAWAAPDPRGRFRGRTRQLAGAAMLLEELGAVVASVSVDSFSQVNPLAAGGLFLDAAEAAGSGGRALDLYAGSGILGMHLATRFDEVIAIEISADAVRRGRSDAKRLGIDNLTFVRADARGASRSFPADVVVVDPPRAGLSEATRSLLIEQRPARIVAISCDPTTWARDVAALCTAGYRLTLVRPYDFYPCTHHVEVLSILER